MSVVIETTLGDITIDLYVENRPRTCLNFLKLCKVKYYNLCLFHKIERNFMAQTGDPSGTGRGGESVFCQLYGDQAKYFESELKPRRKHEKLGTVSMVNNGNNMNGSQFFFTLGENLTYLDEVHTVFGEIVEGFETLLKLNEAICDPNNRPYQDIRITHTVILHDPYEDPGNLDIPPSSPIPTEEQLQSNYIAVGEEIDDTKGKNVEEIEEKIKDSEAKARATILEMVGDIPDADVKPPENVLFVCKLNPVTTSEDLEVIFSRFGVIKSCEVIKDGKSGESLQYAFIEFEKEEDCENAFFKMDNVLIDDRRIHVDFSQSVSKMNHDLRGQMSGAKKKRQNFVLKESLKRSDGYEMVFDSDDDAVSLPVEKQKDSHHSKRNTSSSHDAKSKHDRYTEKKKVHHRSRNRSRSSSHDRDQASSQKKHSEREKRYSHSNRRSREKEVDRYKRPSRRSRSPEHSSKKKYDSSHSRKKHRHRSSS